MESPLPNPPSGGWLKFILLTALALFAISFTFDALVNFTKFDVGRWFFKPITAWKNRGAAPVQSAN